MSKRIQEYSAKVGRFNYELQSKKVTLCKDKGRLTVYRTAEQQIYLSWVNLQKNIQQIHIMVFAFDYKFQKLTNKNNTYLLSFESNNDKYFFWLQENIPSDQFIKQVQSILSSLPQSEEESMEMEEMEEEQIENPSVYEPHVTKPTSSMEDMIRRMQAGRHTPQPQIALKAILTQQCITRLLNQCSPEQLNQLATYLPEGQQKKQELQHNMRSMQFLQAVDVLSDAFNSQNALPLFMEMGLDTKLLTKEYGVNAFLMALLAKHKKE